MNIEPDKLDLCKTAADSALAAAQLLLTSGDPAIKGMVCLERVIAAHHELVRAVNLTLEITTQSSQWQRIIAEDATLSPRARNILRDTANLANRKRLPSAKENLLVEEEISKIGPILALQDFSKITIPQFSRLRSCGQKTVEEILQFFARHRVEIKEK